MHRYTRREFLVAASTAAAGGAWARQAAGGQDAAGQVAPHQTRSLPTVALGSTGRIVPRLGLGTAPVARLESEEQAIAILRRAFDLGVRYLDTAPSYSRGRSETLIGLALEGYDRSEFFIATKTLYRNGDEARRDVEGSLRRLKVEYVDSVQAHAVSGDVDALFGPQAVLKGLEKARGENLVRHIGVTGHANPKYLIDAIRRYPFATVLVPVNPMDASYLSFGRELLPVARERKIPVIAMKVFADGALLRAGLLTAHQCLHYALSRDPVAVVVPGCDAIGHVDEAHAAVIDFKPLTAKAQAELEKLAGAARGEKDEWYKERKKEG